MAKKTKIKWDARWAEAKRKCRLNAETVRMAKELGLNPRKLIKNIPSKAQPWKAPVQVWVRDMYARSQAKAARKRAKREMTPVDNGDAGIADGSATVEMRQPPPVGPRDRDARVGDHGSIPFPEDRPDNVLSDDVFPGFEEDGWLNDGPPGNKEIAEQNRFRLRRQEDYRIAANRIASALWDIPAVRKVALFGSVAAPLEKEVPRFREFRRAGIAVWHECKEVDLAIWVDDLSSLKRLRKARSKALNDLLRDMDIGVAHHQVEMFILEPGTDRYLGRLCCFGHCPRGKPECAVAGCGTTPFLRQHEDFTFRSDALASERVVVLYDRGDESGEVLGLGEIPF